MKKLILTVTLIAGSLAAFGQGQLVMNNNAATAITNRTTGLRWAAGPNSQVAIYAAAGNDQPRGSLTLQTTAMTNLFAPGLFSGGNRTLSVPVGPASIQIRAWSGAFGSYEAATTAALAGDTSIHFGESIVFNMTLATAPAPLPATQNSMNPFTVQPVPEPSSIALGLLGLGAIALFRRRK